MTHAEALDIAAFAQGAIPMTSAQQAAVLKEILNPFPDAEFARALIKRHAAESDRLSVSWIRAELNNEIRRRQLDTASIRKAHERQTEEETDHFWRAADSWAQTLTPDEDAELTELAMRELPAAAQDFLRKRKHTVKSSRVLRGKAFEMVRVGVRG